MENKYYDTWEFQQALSCMENDPVRANLKFEEYLNNYPRDYSMISYYIANLITLGKFEKALKYLEYLEKSASEDENFLRQPKKAESLSNNILFNKIRLFSYMGKHNEVYKLYLSAPKEMRDTELNTLIVYCKSKIGKIKHVNKEKTSYINGQIMDYSEEDFLEHIKKHLADYNSNLDDPNKNVFSPGFPITDVLSEIRKYIPSSKRLYPGFYENTYIFKYAGCGRDNNKTADYFKVVCFNNTRNIITLVPIAKSKVENLPYVDLNYMDKKTNNDGVKKESQIEKFNRRFKRG